MGFQLLLKFEIPDRRALHPGLALRNIDLQILHRLQLCASFF
jgi:hypothetical protein